MRVTFLAHSGFLVELPSALLLFDYLGAGLPALPDKPLLIFASHRHEDHFTPSLFPLEDGSRETYFPSPASRWRPFPPPTRALPFWLPATAGPPSTPAI